VAEIQVKCAQIEQSPRKVDLDFELLLATFHCSLYQTVRHRNDPHVIRVVQHFLSDVVSKRIGIEWIDAMSGTVTFKRLFILTFIPVGSSQRTVGINVPWIVPNGFLKQPLSNEKFRRADRVNLRIRHTEI